MQLMEENAGELQRKIELVEEECFCGVCKELFRMPVTVPCGHNFCLHCLSDIITLESECPVCRAVISGGLFKVNRALWNSMKILFEDKLHVANAVPDGVLVVANPAVAAADGVAAAGDDLAEAAAVDLALDDPPGAADGIAAAGDDLAEAAAVYLALDDPFVRRALVYAMLGSVIVGGLLARMGTIRQLHRED